MRRITIYTDEESAPRATAWLEQQGFDYMSEDYAAPDLKRRPPPERRQEPERHEGGTAQLLGKTKVPVAKQKPGRKLGPLASFIIQTVREAGTLSTEEIEGLCADRGWKGRRVADTIYRLRARGQLSVAPPWKLSNKEKAGG